MKKLIRITTVPMSLRILLKGQHKFMLSNGIEVVGVSSQGEELKEVAENEGIRVHAIEMSRKITPIQDMISLWKMWRFLLKEKPDIVHTHTPKAGIIGMLAAKLAGVPNRLHTVAGLPLMEALGKKRQILNLVEKLTYSCATMVYPNSKGLNEFILKNGFIQDKKLKVIANGSSNGIDTDFFSTEKISEEQKKLLIKELEIEPNDFIYIFVGRIVGDKGINELVKAFKNINKKNIKLILLGGFENDLDPLAQETMLEIEKNKNIILAGFQKDVRPYLAISNVLVFPSYREGFPNVVMQAGAMGLPSIVSDINGCNEIIVQDKNGIIIPSKNIEKLQEKMLLLYDNKELYENLKNNSRSMIVDRYEQSIVWNAIWEEYKKMLY